MWAQLIQMRLKPGEDTAEMIELIRSAEQPGSGLVRSIFMRDQADPGHEEYPCDARGPDKPTLARTSWFDELTMRSSPNPQ